MNQILQEEVLEPMGFAGKTCFQDSPKLRRTPRAATG